MSEFPKYVIWVNKNPDWLKKITEKMYPKLEIKCC